MTSEYIFGIIHQVNNILHGGVAQLGERLNGIQEVIGSIPTVSTKIPFSKEDGILLFTSSLFLTYSLFTIPYRRFSESKNNIKTEERFFSLLCFLYY